MSNAPWVFPCQGLGNAHAPLADLVCVQVEGAAAEHVPRGDEARKEKDLDVRATRQHLGVDRCSRNLSEVTHGPDRRILHRELPQICGPTGPRLSGTGATISVSMRHADGTRASSETAPGQANSMRPTQSKPRYSQPSPAPVWATKCGLRTTRKATSSIGELALHQDTPGCAPLPGLLQTRCDQDKWRGVCDCLAITSGNQVGGSRPRNAERPEIEHSPSTQVGTPAEWCFRKTAGGARAGARMRHSSHRAATTVEESCIDHRLTRPG